MRKIILIVIVLTILTSCVTSIGVGTRVGRARGGVKVDSTGKIGGGISIGF